LESVSKQKIGVLGCRVIQDVMNMSRYFHVSSLCWRQPLHGAWLYARPAATKVNTLEHTLEAAFVTMTRMLGSGDGKPGRIPPAA